MYIYTKTTEDISIFEDIMEIIHKTHEKLSGIRKDKKRDDK